MCKFLLLTACFAAMNFSSPAMAADDEPNIPALQEAAERGDADAQFQLGSAYQQGDGVAQNDLQAIHWITRAANQGNLDAQYNLGMAFRGGYGVPQDIVTSYMWLEIAVNNGSVKAFDLRRDVASTMSLDQINDAKYKAARWKPTAAENNN